MEWLRDSSREIEAEFHLKAELNDNDGGGNNNEELSLAALLGSPEAHGVVGVLGGGCVDLLRDVSRLF